MDKAREKYLRDIISHSVAVEGAREQMSWTLGFSIGFLVIGSFITADGGSAGTTCSAIGMILLIPSLAFCIQFMSLAAQAPGKRGFFTNFQKEREKAQSEISALAAKQRKDEAYNLMKEGGLTNLQEALAIVHGIGYKSDRIKALIAQEKEKLLDYAGAIKGFEELKLHEDAARVRRKMLDEKKVDQTVVHGDYIDDRDTIIKDSVVNRSNIGAGGKSKAEQIGEIKDLLDSGDINDDEFKQMKKEILEK